MTTSIASFSDWTSLGLVRDTALYNRYADNPTTRHFRISQGHSKNPVFTLMMDIGNTSFAIATSKDKQPLLNLKAKL